MPRTIFPIMFVLFIILSSCQRSTPDPGIEGQITIFGLNVPASGVTVTAITKTDIKEQQSKAVVRTKTDNSGHFIIRGLLPNKYYKLQISDQSFIGSEEDVETPHEGTRIVEKPLMALPIPPSKGIWIYTSNVKAPTEIMSKAKNVTINELYIYPDTYHSRYAFFIEKQKVDNSITAKIPRNSIIVSRGEPLADIGFLFHIPAKTFYISKTWANNKMPVDIKDGYYYNMSNFFMKPSMNGWIECGMNYHDPKAALPIVENKNKSITGIAANKSISNYLMLTTKTYYAPEKNYLITNKSYLGIVDYKCPAEGIIIQILKNDG